MIIRIAFGIVCCCCLSAAQARAATLYSCPPVADRFGDSVSNGFYVSNYPGTSLDTLTLTYGDRANASFIISVTARLNSYDGALIGTAQRAVNFGPIGVPVDATFNFNNARVPFGSIVTFTHTVISGPAAELAYDLGPAFCPGVTETASTTPPLDVFRGSSVAVTITGSAPGEVAPTPALSIWAAVILALGLAGVVRVRRE